jgi:hypothetical protein
VVPKPERCGLLSCPRQHPVVTRRHQSLPVVTTAQVLHRFHCRPAVGLPAPWGTGRMEGSAAGSNARCPAHVFSSSRASGDGLLFLFFADAPPPENPPRIKTHLGGSQEGAQARQPVHPWRQAQGQDTRYPSQGAERRRGPESSSQEGKTRAGGICSPEFLGSKPSSSGRRAAGACR